MNTKKDPENVSFWLPSSQNSTKIDILTPHKLSVVFLIQEYLQLKQNAAEKQIEFTAQHRKQFSLLLLKLIQYPDMSYKDLHGLLTSPTYGIHPAHLEGFEKFLKMLNQIGIEVLHDLQQLMDKLMSESAATNGGVTQTGIVGLYLRRVHVTLDKMNFSEVMTLYKSVVIYYEKGVRALAICPDAAMSDADIESKAIVKDRYNQSKWSIKQSELFIAQQSALLQNNETQALRPKEMQNTLCQIIQGNPLFSQAYFLCFMNSVRIRDYFNACDVVHRAFDRSRSSITENKGYQYSR
jgi:anaphase-promoting complex subunit 5